MECEPRYLLGTLVVDFELRAAGDLYKTLAGLWMPQLAGEGRRSVLT